MGVCRIEHSNETNPCLEYGIMIQAMSRFWHELGGRIVESLACQLLISFTSNLNSEKYTQAQSENPQIAFELVVKNKILKLGRKDQ